MATRRVHRNTIVLFDVDTTLTVPMKAIEPETIEFLKELHKYVDIGTVGGSDLPKLKKQLGENVLDYDFLDYVFTENGVVSYTKGKCFHSMSFRERLGQENYNTFVNYVLKYIADLDIPVKTGTFIEARQSMLNLSPIGRNCTQSERDAFEKYDEEHHVRKNMILGLKNAFPNLDLTYSVGGQISMDVFPRGWDKTYCLQFIQHKYKNIVFFGDKCKPGGNDYEIFTHPATIGYAVKNHHETIRIGSTLMDTTLYE